MRCRTRARQDHVLHRREASRSLSHRLARPAAWKLAEDALANSRYDDAIASVKVARAELQTYVKNKKPTGPTKARCEEEERRLNEIEFQVEEQKRRLELERQQRELEEAKKAMEEKEKEEQARKKAIEEALDTHNDKFHKPQPPKEKKKQKPE